MGFFSGKSRIKVRGYKELTNAKPPMEFVKPKVIAVPLKHMGVEAFDVHVKIGDMVKIGTKIATRSDHFTVPLFSSVSGKVIGIEKRDHSTIKKTQHIIIENDFNDEKELLAEPIDDINHLTREFVNDAIKNFGIVGLGGAGFPTYVKYVFADNTNTVLLNGVECEPYITTDDLYMKQHPELLVQGLLLLMKAADADNGIIAIKEDKKELFQFLTDYRLGHYKGYNIKIVQVTDRYPVGWERVLIRNVCGLEYDRLPSEAGVVVNNTTTAISLANCIKTGMPMYERYVTFSGNGFKKPQNAKVRIGTVLADAIEAIGGYTDDVARKSRLVCGGPMMGASIVSDAVSINTANNAFLCFTNERETQVACLCCGRCIEHCPSNLQPVQISRFSQEKDFDTLKKLAVNKCIGCGTCSYICPSNIDVTEAVTRAKQLYIKRETAI